MFAQLCLTEFEKSCGRVTMMSKGKRCGTFEQTIKQIGISGHSQMQMLADLAGEGCCLFDEVAAMPRSQLQFAIR